MAIFNAIRKFSLFDVGRGDILASRADASGIIVGGAGFEHRYFGNFTYDEEGLQSGFINRSEYYKNGELVYVLTGDEIDIGNLKLNLKFGLMSSALRRILLVGDDTINGSDYADFLTGAGGNDVIFGHDGADIIQDTSGNDTLHGGAGDDIFVVDGDDSIYGGEGQDTLTAPHFPSQYSFHDSKITMWTGKEVTLDSVERIAFGSSTGPEAIYYVDFKDLIDPDGASGPELSPAAEQLYKISDLYIAYFGRAPDVEGLEYWFKEVYTGSLAFEQIALSFSQQVEYRNAYPEGENNIDFIKSIYQNMFNREPDPEGGDYWKAELDGGLARDSFILAVINGAYAATGGAEDKALLENKHDVSVYYAEQLSMDSDEGFDNHINTVLSNVTSDQKTSAVAKELISDAFESESLTLTGIVNDQPLWDSYWG